MPVAREAEKTGREIYAPKSPFVANVDGEDVVFTMHTLVREGHRVLKLYPDSFEPVRIMYDIEQASAAPGEKRAR